MSAEKIGSLRIMAKISVIVGTLILLSGCVSEKGTDLFIK